MEANSLPVSRFSLGEIMKTNRLKIYAIITFALPMLLVSVFRATPTAAETPVALQDAAAVYKAKCAMCHGPKAAKSYNPDLPMEEQLTAVLKGKKAAKPPHMPGFESKGIKEDQAKALIEFMQGLRKPAS